MADPAIPSSEFRRKCRPRRGGNFKHGLSDSRIESIHEKMRQRCGDPKHPYYHLYGGRGISVCEEWLDAGTFYKWAFANGYRDDLQLHRRDNDKGYSPGNCSWVTHIENQNNRRHHVRMEYNGENLTIGEWSRKSGISHGTLWYRHRQGWRPEEILGLVKR